MSPEAGEVIVVLMLPKSSSHLSSPSSQPADQLACRALCWQHMSPPVQPEWPSSVPTVRSYLLFPVMNLLFTEIDPVIFSSDCCSQRALSRQLLNPNVDSMNLDPRRLGLTKIVC